MMEWFVKMMLPGAVAWEWLEPYLTPKPKKPNGDFFQRAECDPASRLNQLTGPARSCRSPNLSRYVLNHLKFMALLGVVVGGLNLKGSGSTHESSEIESRPVLVEEAFDLRGKKYHLKVFRDGEIVVNGRHWHLAGPPGVTFKVEQFHFRSDEEILEIKVQGSIPFIFDRTVHQQFDAVSVQKILPHLMESREPLDTPAMRKYRISLMPGPCAG